MAQSRNWSRSRNRNLSPSNDLLYRISFGDFGIRQEAQWTTRKFLMRNEDIAKITGNHLSGIEQIQRTSGAVITFFSDAYRRMNRHSIIQFKGTAHQIGNAQNMVESKVLQSEGSEMDDHPIIFMPCEISVVKMTLNLCPSAASLRQFEISTRTWVKVKTDGDQQIGGATRSCLTICGPTADTDQAKDTIPTLRSSMENQRNHRDPTWVDLFGPPSHCVYEKDFVLEIRRKSYEAIITVVQAYLVYMLVVSENKKRSDMGKVAGMISVISYWFLLMAFFFDKGRSMKLLVWFGFNGMVFATMLSILLIVMPNASVYISSGLALIAGYRFARKEFKMEMEKVGKWISTLWKKRPRSKWL